MVIIYSRGWGGGGKGAGFYEGHKVFRGGTEGISRRQQSLKGGDYRNGLPFNFQWGGGVGGGQINFIVTKPEYSGDPSPLLQKQYINK